MPELKYAVFPGLVRSKSDGQLHQITTSQLVALYGLKSEEYIAVERDQSYARQLQKALDLGLRHLYPRYSGNYTLPILQEKSNGRS